MATHQAALEAMERARRHVPEVIRTFMRVRSVSQEQLGFALGLTQRQVSRRLNVAGAISQEELAGLAAIFGVPPETFYKPLADALADLFKAPAPMIVEGATPQNEAKGASLRSVGTYVTVDSRGSRPTSDRAGAMSVRRPTPSLREPTRRAA